MYLHLRKDVLVRAKDVIGIFDLETTTTGEITRDYLGRAERQSQITNVSSELPKSFILTRESGVERIYISAIAPSTLQRRLEEGEYVMDEKKRYL